MDAIGVKTPPLPGRGMRGEPLGGPREVHYSPAMASRKKKRSRRTLEQQLEDLQKELEGMQEQLRTRERFSPEKLAAHRAKLELSAADYGELMGVSALTVYNWEKGKTQPRSAQIDSWMEIRNLGKREAWKRLGYA